MQDRQAMIDYSKQLSNTAKNLTKTSRRETITKKEKEDVKKRESVLVEDFQNLEKLYGYKESE